MRAHAVVSLAIVSAVALAGRARAQDEIAGAELRCSLAIQPIVIDPATGVRVRASPDRFELRSLGGEAEIRAERGGWSVRASATRFEYALVDRRTSAVVVHETALLSCAREPMDASPPIALASGAIVEGDTRTRARLAHGTCGGGAGPEQWHVLRLDAPRRIALRLASSFDATMYVRAGSIDGAEVACRDESERFEALEINLAPGVYYVAVDARDEGGRYRLQAFEHAADPRALASTTDRLVPGRDVEGVLVPGASHHGGRCGGQHGPEHVYALHLDAPSRVSLHLESRFDAALYLRSARGEELDCGVVLGDPGDVRLPRASASLGPGDYYVIVDGAARRTGTGWYRLSVELLRLP